MVCSGLGALAWYLVAGSRDQEVDRVRDPRSPVALVRSVAGRLGVFATLTYLGVEAFSNGAAAAGLIAGVGLAHLPGVYRRFTPLRPGLRPSAPASASEEPALVRESADEHRAAGGATQQE